MTVPLDRRNHETWRTFYDPHPMHSMLYQHWGLGHSQAVWDVRQNPKVVNVFADIWHTPDLLTSFDGLSLHIPPEVTKRGYFHKSWYHCDQSFTDSSLRCVQGMVSMYPTNAGDATLAVLAGSHLLHAEFAQAFNITDKADWYRITDEQKQWFLDRGCTEEFIESPAGSMILWDSRTIHCGREAVKGRATPNFRWWFMSA